MNHEELYEFSKELVELVKEMEDLNLFHYYRYKYFVDNSSFEDPERECKYVIRTKAFGEKQEDLLREELIKRRDCFDRLIGKCPASQVELPKEL